MFRGQTVNYDDLSPTGLRRPLRQQVIWQVYSDQLYFGLTQEFTRGPVKLSAEYLQAQNLWFKALAQHYGPGSDFLDVTYSLDAALWFALNKTSTIHTSGPIGPAGPVDPVRDHESSIDIVRYDPWDETGWLYVLTYPYGTARAWLARARSSIWRERRRFSRPVRECAHKRAA